MLMIDLEGREKPTERCDISLISLPDLYHGIVRSSPSRYMTDCLVPRGPSTVTTLDRIPILTVNILGHSPSDALYVFECSKRFQL